MKLREFSIYNQSLSSFVGEVAIHYAMRFLYGSLHVAPRSQFDAGDVDVEVLLELDDMPDDKLCRIPGIGPATIAKLRLAASIVRDKIDSHVPQSAESGMDQRASA